MKKNSMANSMAKEMQDMTPIEAAFVALCIFVGAYHITQSITKGVFAIVYNWDKIVAKTKAFFINLGKKLEDTKKSEM
jgi:hypothetical protein